MKEGQYSSVKYDFGYASVVADNENPRGEGDDVERAALHAVGESSRKRGYKRKQKDRERIVGAERLYKEDYFADSPVYSEKDFRMRFGMRRSLFLRIVEALQMNVPYFLQRRDATGMLGLSSLQKVTAAVRLLAYDLAGDVVDEYLRIGASSALECLKIFCMAVYDIFSEQYLRQPTREDVARLTAENARRGFPGMLGNIDCMH
ncbi:uncharacterized protein [Henckelia pumila]|uniref:uncharacterized protein n=1 Tax=Henckelia pumila TaxID=405737 RepID=UPI003C6E689E